MRSQDCRAVWGQIRHVGSDPCAGPGLAPGPRAPHLQISRAGGTRTAREAGALATDCGQVHEGNKEDDVTEQPSEALCTRRSVEACLGR